MTLNNADFSIFYMNSESDFDKQTILIRFKKY